MAISMNTMNNNVEAKGFKANEMFRNAVNNELYKQSIVITKIELSKDENGTVVEKAYYGTVGDTPLLRAFGLSNKVMNNVLINIAEEDEAATKVRVNIDGQRYILSENIISIKCADDNLISKLAKYGYDYNGEHYIAVCSSPSTEKHAVKYYAKVTADMPDELTAFNIIDKIAGGVYSYKLFNKTINGKDVTKLNTRFGNYASTMKSLAQIDLTKDYIIIVDGSINGDTDWNEETIEEMEAKGIEIDNHINDGANYFAPDVILDMASKLNVKYNKRDALKTALQVRTTYVTGKTMCRVLEPQDMIAMAEMCEEQGQKVIAYGNTINGRCLALFDTDGAKAINEDGLRNGAVIDIYVMAVAHASRTHTSSQHMIKYVEADAEAAINFTKENLNEQLYNFLADQIDNEASITSVDSRIIHAIKDEAFNNQLLMESLLKDAFKFAKASMTKNRIAMKGIYSHMMFDATYALTQGRVRNVLGIYNNLFVEAYSADINRKYHKEIAEIENNNELTEEEKDAQLFELLSGVVVKYPSAMPKEYEIVVYLTDRQIRNRLKAMNITNEDRRTLQQYFNNTPYGCTVYAPINAMKNKLAGADCDFDATMTDMSELKQILIAKRRNEGFMGDCTVISYK